MTPERIAQLEQMLGRGTICKGHIAEMLGAIKQRTWVGLTDDEYKELHLQIGPVYYYQEYGQAIEAKLKEKNT